MSPARTTRSAATRRPSTRTSATHTPATTSKDAPTAAARARLARSAVNAGLEPKAAYGRAKASNAPYVTVVLPCYNEREHVLAEIERISAALEQSGYSYELLVIDDGSSDGTREVLEQAAQDRPNIRFMPFARNQGSGTARRIGTEDARGEIVVWTDADMTYPNERIPELVQMLDDDPSFDQVVGARRSEEGTYKLLRVPAKWFIRRIASYLTQTKIPDLNSGLRAFRRDVSLPYLRLLPPGFSCVTTLTVAFLSNNHDVRYVDIDYFKRAGKSKFHPLHDAYRYILQVLRMVMYFNPLKVLMPLALWILGIGVAKLVYDLIAHPFRVAINTVLLFVTGLIITSVALLADLVVRSRST
ncbi:MAG: glycosyltransferase family 2 protein [Mycobacteriales bacterium]|nr:glycosyltransferase family 2 protein [Frankia sp.]